MRWFKHMTSTRHDEKISAYIDECGMEGYGVYWSILEAIGTVMEKSNGWKTEVTYPLSRWATILQLHRTKVSKYLGYLGGKGGGNLEDTPLLLVTNSEKGVTVKCPNLAKYKDEYSKKSGHTPDIVQTHSGQTPEQDTDTKTETELETNLNTEIEDKNTSSEAKKPASSLALIPENIFISIHLVDGSEFPIGEELVEEYQKCYPGIDVRQSLRDIRAYFFSSPKKRKTRRGILTCVNGWLGRNQNQNRGGGMQAQSFQPRQLNNVDKNQLLLEKILREEEEKYGKQNLLDSGVTHDHDG